MSNLRYSISGTFTIFGEAENIAEDELEKVLLEDLRENLTNFNIDEIEIEEIES